MIRILGTVCGDSVDGTVNPTGELATASLALFASRPNTAIEFADLIDFLWPEGPTDSAPSAARTQCARVRKMLKTATANSLLETSLRTGTTYYTLRVADDDLDSLRFRALLRVADDRVFGGMDGAAADALEEALRLWRGTPFEDVDRAGLLGVAARLETERLSAIETLGAIYLRLGRYSTAILLLEPLAPHHRSREQMAASLMYALFRSGRTEEALGVYRATRNYLVEELGLDPCRELVDLEHAILNREVLQPSHAAHLGRVRGSAAVPAVRRGPFVGRERFLQQLSADVASGGVLIVGEAGAGKSRLLDEWVAQIKDRLDVIVVRADEDSIGIGDLIREILYSMPAIVGPLSGVTDLLLRFDSSVRDAADGPSTKTELNDIVRDLDATLVALGQQIVIVVDDAHLADSVSLRLLRWWMRHRTAQVAFVLAARSGPSETWDGFLSDGSAYGSTAFRALAPLTVEDVEHWIRQTNIKVPVATEVVSKQLVECTAGSPFFLEHLIREIGKPGADASELMRMLHSPDVPEDIDELLQARIRRLDYRVRQGLAVAATIGREFTTDEVDAVATECFGQTDWVIDERTSDGLVAEGRSPGTLRFRHDIARAAFLPTMSGEQRRLVHRVLFDRRFSADLEDARRAWHAAAAVPLVEASVAIAELRDAADRAMRASSFAEAVALLQKAITLAEEFQPIEAAIALDIRIERARASQQLGARSSSIQELTDVLDSAINSGHSEIAARCALAAADFGEILDREDTVRHLLESALQVQIPGSPEQTELAAELVIKRGIIDGRTLELEALHRDVVSRGSRSTTERSWLHLIAGSPGASDRLKRAQQLALDAQGDRHLSARVYLDALLFEVSALLELGRTEFAASRLSTYKEAARISGRPGVRWLALVGESDLLQTRGELVCAEEAAQEALQFGLDNGVPDSVASFGGHALVTELLRGDVAGLLDTVSSDDVTLRPLARVAGSALVLAAAGKKELAQAAIQVVLDELSTAPTSTLTPCTIMLAAEAAITIGMVEATDRLIPVLEPYAGTMPRMALVGTTLGPVDRQIGRLFAIQGDLARGLRLVQSGLDLARFAGAPAWQLRSAIDLADLGHSAEISRTVSDCRAVAGAPSLAYLLDLAEAARP